MAKWEIRFQRFALSFQPSALFCFRTMPKGKPLPTNINTTILGTDPFDFLLAILLFLLAVGRAGAGTLEKNYELKSGDTVIIESQWTARGFESGPQWKSSKLFIHWKQGDKTEEIAGEYQGYDLNPSQLTLITNKDFIVLGLGNEIQWRSTSRKAKWNSFTPTNSPAIWSFIKKTLASCPPNSYKPWKDGDGHELLFIRGNPAEIILRDDWPTIYCTKIRIDFERHRLITACAENGWYPKLVFVEDGQFGRWKFDEHASEAENAPATAVP